MTDKDKKRKRFSHWATSPEDCENMARRNPGWNLVKIENDGSNSILDTECQFEETDDRSHTTEFYQED